jgi:hypothetical protein
VETVLERSGVGLAFGLDRAAAADGNGDLLAQLVGGEEQFATAAAGGERQPPCCSRDICDASPLHGGRIDRTAVAVILDTCAVEDEARRLTVDGDTPALRATSALVSPAASNSSSRRRTLPAGTLAAGSAAALIGRIAQSIFACSSSALWQSGHLHLCQRQPTVVP